MNVIKKISAIVAIAFIGVILVGCTYVTEGTVTEKKFDEAHTTYTTYCTGKPMVCRPLPVFHDDEWDMNLSSFNEKGEPITGWVEVSEEVYNEIAVGTYYDNKPNE
jgi:hypothetical protein